MHSVCQQTADVGILETISDRRRRRQRVRGKKIYVTALEPLLKLRQVEMYD